MTPHRIRGAIAAVLLATGPAACSGPPPQSPGDAADRPGEHTRAQTEAERANLANFDDLDFNVYTGAHWDQFNRSHAENIVVHYPDGSTTTGLEDHLNMLRPQFEFAPDTRIQQHPIRIAQGDMTAVSGVMEGTFTQSMRLPGGQTIQPTGKSFRLEMATIGRWENGVMVEEWLYWDNQTFMQQIGLAPAP
jgi:predicted ester cyclase